MKNEAKSSYYESVAKNYKNALLLNKCKAAVHVENKNDIPFWIKILEKAYPDSKFDFISYTRTTKGTDATGSSTCLLFKGFLDEKLVLAIDSDLHYLLCEPNFDSSHYILQTYTYSFENHLCHAERLKPLPSLSTHLDNSIFNFEVFLSKLSNEIYPLLLFFLYDQYTSKILVDDDLFKVTSFSYNDQWLANDGECFISDINQKIQNVLERLSIQYPDYDKEKQEAKYTSMGLNKENAYLYFRGHNLYSLIAIIGANICDEILKQEKVYLIEQGESDKIPALYRGNTSFKELLQSSDLCFNYPEIEKCVSDATSIWS